jgi:hypothetical protein
MRDHGERYELVPMRPHDHIGWVFSGPEFLALATPFLTEGAELGERLMYVVEHPDADHLDGLHHLAASGVLQLASIADVYGASGVVDAATQRATFASALAEARAEGYTGIRVAADNTPLVTDPERLEAWIRWELVADQFMSENAVTGLCAFNREHVDVDTLRHLATLHPLFSAQEHRPQFRLFCADGALVVRGEVDVFAVKLVALALEQLPPKTRVLVDLTQTVLVTRAAIRALQGLVDDGVAISLHGANAKTRQLAENLGLPQRCFVSAVDDVLSG